MRPGEGFHPLRPRSGPHRRPKRRLHHFISHSAEKEGIGPVEILDRVTMQVFVCGDCTMIAAPIQCDVESNTEGVAFERGEGRFSTDARKLNNLRKSLEARVGIGPETPLFRATLAQSAARINLSLVLLEPASLISIGVRFGVRWPPTGRP